MSETVDRAEFAALLRVTEKTVHDWIKAGMPVESRGSRGGGKERDKTRIDLRDAVEWYFAENYERLELDRQRTRLASEQAQKIAIENALAIDSVGELDIWQQELEKLLSEIRAAFLGLPTKLAPRLDGDVNQRKDRLEAAVHEVLRQLAEYRPSPTGPRGKKAARNGADDIEPAAASNGKRMGRKVSKAIARK